MTSLRGERVHCQTEQKGHEGVALFPTLASHPRLASTWCNLRNIERVCMWASPRCLFPLPETVMADCFDRKGIQMLLHERHS